MRRRLAWVLVVALALLVALVAWQGATDVVGLLRQAGWRLALLSLFAVPNVVLAGLSWRLLLAREARPGFGTLMQAVWVGGAWNTLMPVASVGGDAVRIRLLTLRGAPGAEVAASVVVDKIVQGGTTVVLAGIAGVLLAVLSGGGGAALAGIVLSALLLAVGLGVFMALASRGTLLQGVARRVPRGRFPRLAEALSRRAGLVDAQLARIHARPGPLALSLALRVVARLVLAGEVWLAAQWMGFPVGVVEAVAIRSLAWAARGTAFVVPGGVGVQEGASVAAASLLGLPLELGVSLSLAMRVRELLVGVPGLAAWPWIEARALRARADAGRVLSSD
jgi:putative membrane protein